MGICDASSTTNTLIGTLFLNCAMFGLDSIDNVHKTTRWVPIGPLLGVGVDLVLYLEPNFEFGLRLELELELEPEGLDRDRKSEETM